MTIIHSDAIQASSSIVAERGRFELPKSLRPCHFSKVVHSTTLPPLHGQITIKGIKTLCSDFDSDVVPASQSHVFARHDNIEIGQLQKHPELTGCF